MIRQRGVEMVISGWPSKIHSLHASPRTACTPCPDRPPGRRWSTWDSHIQISSRSAHRLEGGKIFKISLIPARAGHAIYRCHQAIS